MSDVCERLCGIPEEPIERRVIRDAVERGELVGLDEEELRLLEAQIRELKAEIRAAAGKENRDAD